MLHAYRWTSCKRMVGLVQWLAVLTTLLATVAGDFADSCAKYSGWSHPKLYERPKSRQHRAQQVHELGRIPIQGIVVLRLPAVDMRSTFESLVERGRQEFEVAVYTARKLGGRRGCLLMARLDHHGFDCDECFRQRHDYEVCLDVAVRTVGVANGDFDASSATSSLLDSVNRGFTKAERALEGFANYSKDPAAWFAGLPKVGASALDGDKFLLRPLSCDGLDVQDGALHLNGKVINRTSDSKGKFAVNGFDVDQTSRVWRGNFSLHRMIDEVLAGDVGAALSLVGGGTLQNFRNDSVTLASVDGIPRMVITAGEGKDLMRAILEPLEQFEEDIADIMLDIRAGDTIMSLKEIGILDDLFKSSMLGSPVPEEESIMANRNLSSKTKMRLMLGFGDIIEYTVTGAKVAAHVGAAAGKEISRGFKKAENTAKVYAEKFKNGVDGMISDGMEDFNSLIEDLDDSLGVASQVIGNGASYVFNKAKDGVMTGINEIEKWLKSPNPLCPVCEAVVKAIVVQRARKLATGKTISLCYLTNGCRLTVGGNPRVIKRLTGINLDICGEFENYANKLLSYLLAVESLVSDTIASEVCKVIQACK